MCKSFSEFVDDVLGINPPQQARPNPVARPQRQIIGRAPTLTGGLSKSMQRRAEVEAMKKRQGKKASRRAGKGLLTINRVAPVGGAQPMMTAAGSPTPMSGINYG